MSDPIVQVKLVAVLDGMYVDPMTPGSKPYYKISITEVSDNFDNGISSYAIFYDGDKFYRAFKGDIPEVEVSVNEELYKSAINRWSDIDPHERRVFNINVTGMSYTKAAKVLDHVKGIVKNEGIAVFTSHQK